MKKILALFLAMMLMLSAVACGNTETENGDTENGGGGDTGSAIVTPAVDDNTMGANIWNFFKTTLEATPDKTPEELATILIENTEIIPYMCGAMSVQPGLLTGFDNYKVTGFKKGAVFMPNIGTIPFVGYVFQLADNTEAEAFLKKLSDNCNLRWNICSEAEQVVAGAYGNMALFVMCPKSPDGSYGW